MTRKPRIAIIGAGPIGLEAALYAQLRGYEVAVFERGRIAESVRQWGHVRMFSPFGMNSSEWGRGALRETGLELPEAERILSGDEFVVSYLNRLASVPYVRESLRCDVEVDRIYRDGQLKTSCVGTKHRADTPLKLLLNERGRESYAVADVVLDCSGTYPNHNWLGGEGGPCPGERSLQEFIQYDLSPIDRVYDGDYLVAGLGHSAATNLIALSRMWDDVNRCSPVGHITLLGRRGDHCPFEISDDDLLPERSRLMNEAADVLASSEHEIEYFPCHAVERLDRSNSDRIRVQLVSLRDKSTRTIEVNRIIANVGYRPDRSLYEELQVHECYATQGPMKLAAKLLGETSADCLDQTSHGPEVLRNPEPNFYILGMKSYGRNSNFLIQVGLQQIVDVFALIENDWGA